MKTSRDVKSACALVAACLLCASIVLAQPSSLEEEKLKGAKLFDEAFALFQKGTAESLREAKFKFESAEEIFRKAGDKLFQASALVVLGRLENDLGEKTAAIERYKQALPLLRDIDEKTGELAALNNIAAAYTTLGENYLALKYYEQSLLLTREVGDKGMEGTLLSNLGGTYALLGDQKTALKLYEQSLPLIRADNDKHQQVVTLSNIGFTNSQLGEHETALKYFEQALAIARLIKDQRFEATALSNVAGEQSSLGNKLKAIELDTEALSLRRIVGDREGEATTLNNLATEYLELGEPRKALENLAEALPLRRMSQDVLGEAATLKNIFATWRVLGNERLAVFYGKQSVNTYQRLRTNIRELSIDLQRTYLRSIDDLYRHLAMVLIKSDRLSEAQQTLNWLKDQQFYDFSQKTQKGSARLALPLREQVLSDAYEASLERVGVAGKQLEQMKQRLSDSQAATRETTAELKRIESNYQTAIDEFVAVLKRAESEFSTPLTDQDAVREIPDLREMQTMLRDISQQTGQRAVTVYQLVSANDFLLLLITAEGAKGISIRIDDTVLQERAMQFWALLQSDKYDPRPLGQELYNVIFRPLEKELPKDTKTILWSLDGNLRYVPMAALYDGKRYLVERYNHVNFTRAESERMTRPVTPRWTASGFGTSAAHTVELQGQEIRLAELPGVNEELQLLFKQKSPAGLFEGETLQDASFTKTAMLAVLKQKRPLVHIASHFAFRPGDEERSFLLLGDGSAFTLAEMKQQEALFAGVELLTLSACNTGAQQMGANGREIDAFAELAQRLGANSVLASLWPVADSSTPWLMRKFYHSRQQQALNKAEALRLAQLALLNGRAQPSPAKQKRMPPVTVVTKGVDHRSVANTRADIIFVDEKNALPYHHDPSKRFAHPYYWSPFILIGNWQ
jgi:CHAT domain-containing protein/Tfp pilus assembly protein PilF